MSKKEQEAEKSLELSRLTEIETRCGKDRAQWVYETAKIYIELGWPVIPIEYGAKTLPLPKTLKKRNIQDSLKYSDASTAPDVIDRWFSPKGGLFRGFNIGIVCGISVSALDLDIKRDVNGYANYLNEIGPPPGRTPAQRTPSGGSHFLFRHTPGFRSSTKIFPGVDTRGCKRTGEPGSHIVVYPSVVSKGDGSDPVMYQWQSGGAPADPPEELIKRLDNVVQIKNKRPSGTGRGNEGMGEDDYFPEASLEDVKEALKYVEADDYDTWVQIGMAIHYQWDDAAGFETFHEWSKTSENYKSEKDCWGKWSTFQGDQQGVTTNTLFWHARSNGYRKEGDLSTELLHNLRRNSKGVLLPTHHNTWVLMQSPEFHEEYGGPLNWDAFRGEVKAGNTVFVNEKYTDIQRWMATRFHFERGKDTCRDYARMVAMDNPQDSLTNWAKSLEWDREDRMDNLYQILKASNDYQQAAVRRWLIGGIARAFQPGCTSTHMLILFGNQGIGKSRFFKAISPNPSWFSDSTTFKFSRDTSHRDEEIKLEGKFIIEVAELAGIWKSDFEDLKSFLSKPVGTIRRPYDTDSVDLPRRCIFGGTTNTDQILADPTGGRRFAFLRLGAHKIDVPWVEENCDQIWAQAKYFMTEGNETWWFDDEEFAAQIEDNKKFEREHPWKAVILEWAADKSRFSNEDIFDMVLHLAAERRTQAHLQTIKSILEPEGWRRVTSKVETMATRPRLWRHPNNNIDNQYAGTKWMPSNAVDDEGEPEH